MSPEGPYPEQTCAERKNALFNSIIDLFDKGKVTIYVGVSLNYVQYGP